MRQEFVILSTAKDLLYQIPDIRLILCRSATPILVESIVALEYDLLAVPAVVSQLFTHAGHHVI